MNRQEIKKHIASLPQEPGIYMMKDFSGEIIYIGKASDIKKRVTSYFKKNNGDIKTRVLVKNISEIEFIVTDTEIEALILENSLIKKHKPKFNIRLKDDKKYPYIAITMADDYPRVIYTRRLDSGGARYFGPYTDARAAKNIINMINAIFKLKTCKRPIPLKKNERPCVNFQMKKCSGPCSGMISKEDYRILAENAVQFLEGNIEPVLGNLRNLMKGYSENLRYEQASNIRDIINDIKNVSGPQRVHVPVGMDQDFIGVSITSGEAVLILFEFRSGILLNRKIAIYDNINYSSPGDIIRSFIIENYRKKDIPQRIIAQERMDDAALLEKYLTEKRSGRVTISAPVSQNDKGVIAMIKKNIDIICVERGNKESREKYESGLMEIRGFLKLDRTPEIMECFDISNIQGTHAVASMVRFRGGEPSKSDYRRYRIRGYDSPNDPGMIHEAVARRIQYLVNDDKPLPDLIVIDGGRAQLARAKEAAANFNVPVKIISLAKKDEKIFYDEKKNPLRLPSGSPALKILQAIRDEAHRFAVTYHKNLRGKAMMESLLDKIPGVGNKSRIALFRHFKSIEEIKKAGLEDLKTVRGINKKTAGAVYDYFQSKNNSITGGGNENSIS